MKIGKLNIKEIEKSLYFIGERFWTQLKLRNPSLIEDIEKIFALMENQL